MKRSIDCYEMGPTPWRWPADFCKGAAHRLRALWPPRGTRLPYRAVGVATASGPTAWRVGGPTARNGRPIMNDNLNYQPC